MPGILNNSATINWLGGVGGVTTTDKVEFNNVGQALLEMAEFLIEKAENNLERKGNTATGDTAKSMKVVNVQTNANRFSLDIEILSTYKFLDKGVKGVKSGSGKYSFKTKFANKKMAGEIKKWLKVRRIATKYKEISKTELKNKKIKKLVDSADGKLTGLSYAIATNIKKRGIKPTYFFTDAIAATKKEQKKRYADALKLDVIETLNKN